MPTIKKVIECRTQAELNAALELKNVTIRLLGDGEFEVTGNAIVELTGNSQATLYDNSQATLTGNSQARLTGNSQARLTGNSQATLYGNSQATLTGNSHATLYDNSQATLYDNSQARLTGNSQATLTGNSQATLYGNSQATLYDNSQARLTGNSQATLTGNSQARLTGNSQATAGGNSQVRASDSTKVVATPGVAVTRSGQAVVEGGVVIEAPLQETFAQWADFHGVSITGDIVILYKGVNDDYRSGYGFSYLPGTIPVAPDWDGGKIECGAGLHFSPTSWRTLEFIDAKRFLACPIHVNDIAVHKDAHFPSKVKARGLCAPCWEVDIDGNLVKVPPASIDIVKLADWWTREQVEADPERVYVFGDNEEGVGMGGQACIRGLPNAFGIPTLKSVSEFWSDNNYDANVAAIELAIARIPRHGKTWVVSADGLGTGIADLANRAPQTFAYLQARMEGLAKPSEVAASAE